MGKKDLSFNFKFRYGRHIMICLSIVLCFFLLAFSILYLVLGSKNQIAVFFIIFLYCILSGVFDFYLIRSKDIFYDETKIYIREKKEVFDEIEINKIEKVKRVFFYFCRISFSTNAGVTGKRLYYYISPYPSFYRQKALIEILNHKKSFR